MKNKKINLSSNSEANLGNGKWTDIIRVGNWDNSYKEFSITKKDLNKMAENFKANVLGLDQGELQFNFSHDSWAEAAGWIQDLRIEDKVLQAKVRWTSLGEEKIKDEQYKYVSAEIAMNYQDDETGVKSGITLTGAALTNIPFVRGLKAVALSEDSKDANLYIFSKTNRMEKFKKLMESFNDKETLSKVELSTIKGAFAMLSEDEQAEAQTIVDEAQTKLEEEKVVVASESQELSEARQKIKMLEASNQDAVQLNARIQKLEDEKTAANVDIELSNLVASGQILEKEVEANRTLALSLNESNRTQFLDTLKSRAKVVDLGKEIGHGGEPESKKELADGVLDTSAVQKLAKELRDTQGLSADESVFQAIEQLSK